MKKIFGILLVCVMIMTLGLSIIACTPNADGEVKLLSVNGNTEHIKREEKIATIKALPAIFASTGVSEPKFDITENPTTETPSTEEETETGETTEPEVPDLDISSSSKLIYKSQTHFYLTINLENPKNHYIMDFRLSCEGSYIEIKQGSTWSDINAADTYIRWDEAYDRVGNKSATFELRLGSPDVSPDRITISEMYYSSRVDGANKTAVNMDGKETFTIYKIDGPMEMYDRVNSFEEFTFKLNTNGVEIIKVAVDGETITADDYGVYHVLYDGELKITYQYLVGDDNTPEQITSTEQIELLKFTYVDNPEKNIAFISTNGVVDETKRAFLWIFY